MSSNSGTTIGVPLPLAERIRATAEREGRLIMNIVERMTDLYEPLTQLDHAVIAQHARQLHLTPGEALSDIIGQWRERCSGPASSAE